MNLNLRISEIQKLPRWLLPIAVIFFITLFVLAGLFVFEKKFENKIYPGARVGKLNLGGMTFAEAQDRINAKADEFYQQGLIFQYEDRETKIEPINTFMEGEISKQTVNINAADTALSALAISRKGNFFSNFAQKMSLLIFKKDISVSYDIDREEINKILHGSYSYLEIPGADAGLIFSWSDSGSVIAKVSNEKIGKVINYEKAINDLENNLKRLDASPISLYSETSYPQISKKDCLNIEPRAEEILAFAPFNLKFGEKIWAVNKQSFSEWLSLKRDETGMIAVGLEEAKIKEFIDKDISKEIEKEPLEARFDMKDGRVSEFQDGQAGIKIDYAKTLDSLSNLLFSGINSSETKDIEIHVNQYASAIETDKVNNFGIKEIIGTGKSDFSGSSLNRRHNIETGASALNGLLIAPGEEFSTIESLGEIDGKAGYLPELVIKGNKTIPEYGGGLCQVGTTLFRAAVDSGLPITSRRNHSYRVAYYEPAGTDATIYDPSPDFKFVNDTGNYILIQTRIEGNNLYFDLWGAKDGRIVEKTEPTIYNISKPGPAKLIETTDLAPGVKKCTEKAHNGADAYFDYKVTYPLETGSSTPTVKEVRFSSHYVPWSEVCLIGVEKPTEQTATSTPISE